MIESERELVALVWIVLAPPWARGCAPPRWGRISSKLSRCDTR
jgi:hypothetical protein